MPRHAWGIELGDGTLKAVRVRSEGRGYLIVRAIEIPYLDPFLKKKTAPAPLDRRAVAALYQLGSTERIDEFDRIAVGFPSFNAVEGVIEIPRVSEQQRDALISYEVVERIRGDLENLFLTHKPLQLKSSDMEQVQVYGVMQQELHTFIHYLHESKVPYDRIISSSAALVDMARLCVPASSDYLIVSPGFSTTNVVILQQDRFFTRTLPVGLPGAPAQTIEIAHDKVAGFCRILQKEAAAFTKTALGGERFEPSRLMVSGEGARAPGFINTLDGMTTYPVEVLRSSSKVRVKESCLSEGLTNEGVLSMGKAIGLAVGMLEDSQRACLLAGPPPKRRAIHKLPLISAICGIILLFCLGLVALEIGRTNRLESIDGLLNPLMPEHAIETLAGQKNRIDRLKEEIEIVRSAYKDRDRLRTLGEHLSRMEQPSSRNTFGDYHMERLDMVFGENSSLDMTIATRLSYNEAIRKELMALFPPAREPPTLKGPLPAEEETPPAGMAPMVVFKTKGYLK